jgi:hypothetical protein
VDRDGLLADVEKLADLAVGSTRADQREHFELPPRQVVFAYEQPRGSARLALRGIAALGNLCAASRLERDPRPSRELLGSPGERHGSESGRNGVSRFQVPSSPRAVAMLGERRFCLTHEGVARLIGDLQRLPRVCSRSPAIGIRRPFQAGELSRARRKLCRHPWSEVRHAGRNVLEGSPHLLEEYSAAGTRFHESDLVMGRPRECCNVRLRRNPGGERPAAVTRRYIRVGDRAGDGRAGSQRIVLPDGELNESGSPTRRESLSQRLHARRPPVGGFELASFSLHQQELRFDRQLVLPV